MKTELIKQQSKSLRKFRFFNFKSLQVQTGMSAFGLLFFLILFGAIFMLGMKIVPLYMNNNAIDQAFLSASSSNFNDMTKAEIRTSIRKSFQVNGIRDVTVSDIKITQTDSETSLLYAHEDRVNIVTNVDVVIRFENHFNTADQ